MSKRYLNNLDILEYEKDEIASKNLAENGEDKIGDLNRIMNRLKYKKENLEEEMQKSGRVNE